AGRGWNDVGLVPAIGNHVVRALLQAQVLTPIVPADVHQLHGVECAPAPPRCTRGVRGRALERVDDGHQPATAAGTPGGREVAPHVREEGYVDVLEHARPHEVRLAPELLLCDARPDLDGAG